jgi:diguanylate cyclase (GGDEF)-like protein
MNIAALLNNTPLYPLVATGLIHIVLFVNYNRKADTDHFQRRVYLSVLIGLFTAIVSQFSSSVLEGRSGAAVHAALYFLYILYFLGQQFSYYQMVALLDYFAVKNSSRVKFLIRIILIIMAANAVVILLNIPLKFYFFIDEGNRYVNGPYFLIRFYLGYSAILLAIIDMFVSTKFMGRGQLYLVTIFAILMGAGAALDIVVPGEHFIWAFFTAVMLVSYFEIIRNDTTQDSITGIGNRSSFSEFIIQISRMSSKQSYTMAQFDLNGLKQINNEHGSEAGDKALLDMAIILKQCSRRSDFIARIGPDDFIVAIKAKFDIERLIARILRTLENHNQKGERPYTLSVSYGYATFTTKTDQTIEEFLQHLNGLVFQHKSDQREDRTSRN